MSDIKIDQVNAQAASTKNEENETEKEFETNLNLNIETKDKSASLSIRDRVSEDFEIIRSATDRPKLDSSLS